MNCIQRAESNTDKNMCKDFIKTVNKIIGRHSNTSYYVAIDRLSLGVNEASLQLKIISDYLKALTKFKRVVINYK